VNTVRVSILNIPADQIDHVAQLMTNAETALAGIKELPGLISYYAGIDRETSQLSNVSVWESAEHAKAMSTFQPMLDLGKQFLVNRTGSDGGSGYWFPTPVGVGCWAA
jgi:hypothetical protein